MTPPTIKERVRAVADQLPADATLEDDAPLQKRDA
jgi:hypothetical protein